MALSAANAPSGLLCDLLEHPEETVIANTAPQFGWIYHPSFRNDSQTGYRILVASSQTLADAGAGDVWDSGWASNSVSINVPYGGAPLAIGADYFWRVQTADSAGQASPFSAVQHFVTGSATNVFAGRPPLRFVPAVPVLLTNTGPGRWFVDFGQDAFGYATVHAEGAFSPTVVQARFGEMASGLAVNTSPPAGSTVRYAKTNFPVWSGNRTYSVRPPAYSYPPGSVQPPPNYGVVTPFRYFELTGFPGTLRPKDVVQLRLVSAFNPNAASFRSSSAALNQIWTLCRDSMQVLTFDGLYVDGDRERKPYEADAYIQQLSSYAVDREFMMARHSLEYLLEHPTWPTEWKFHNLFMAWADYLQTGETNLLHRHYTKLQADSFTWAAGGGLMKGFPKFPQTTNSDVVDWPAGNRDGFVIGHGGYLNWTNSVNNAFYYRGQRLMANIAAALGRTNDAATYAASANRVYAAYNATFWNNAAQGYVDGVGTSHASAHANFFPLAFGLVPASRQAAVVSFLHSRIAANGGMPCSVYGAQYLLEGLFRAGDADTALGLMTTNGPRGWLHMMALGSTLTTEAWNFADKPNMDWNHAWGAAPGNLIARFVLGLRPVTAGFGQVVIQPHLGRTLTWAQGVVPTIRGPVSISVSNAPGDFQLRVDLPGNVTATVLLPTFGARNAVALVDGDIRPSTLSDNWLVVTNLGAGQHAIWLNTNTVPSAAVLYANRVAGWSGTNAAAAPRLR